MSYYDRDPDEWDYAILVLGCLAMMAACWLVVVHAIAP